MILDYSDLAERWGVKVATLRVWKVRGKLPEPDLMVSGAPAWHISTIEMMEDSNGRPREGSRQP